MSIYGSLEAPSDDDHEDDCDVWDKDESGTIWRMSTRPCSCGLPRSPLAYKGSHVLPSDDDEREGAVDIALIPSHITRDGKGDRPESAGPWPYLRFGVRARGGNEGAQVVLTRANVELIHKTLGEWLASLKE